MEKFEIKLFDIVEMKKAHPCSFHCKTFQIIRVGADIKIMCTKCGRVVMLTRDDFNHSVKKIIENKTEQIKI